MNSPLDEDHFVVIISLNEYWFFELQTALSKSSALPSVCPNLMWLAKWLGCCVLPAGQWVCQSPKLNKTPQNSTLKCSMCFWAVEEVKAVSLTALQLLSVPRWPFKVSGFPFLFPSFFVWKASWFFGGGLVFLGRFWSVFSPKFSSSQDLKPSCSNAELP